jgi:hypothetical protein
MDRSVVRKKKSQTFGFFDAEVFLSVVFNFYAFTRASLARPRPEKQNTMLDPATQRSCSFSYLHIYDSIPKSTCQTTRPYTLAYGRSCRATLPTGITSKAPPSLVVIRPASIDAAQLEGDEPC